MKRQELVPASVLACVLIVQACAPETAAPPGEASRRRVTTHVADAVVAPLLARAQEGAAALRAATAAGELEQAQAAWRELMGAWQGLEMLHLGPAGAPTSFVAGEGLRDKIYAWPQVNPCAVDVQLAEGAFEAEGWAEARLPNVIGLGALEYVLFSSGSGNLCPSDAALNSSGTWVALGTDTLATRRLRYAAVVAADVERRIVALRDAWAPERENGSGSGSGFAAALRTAGTSGSAFATAQQALDEIFAALFAVELVTKDKRLGVPAGLHAPAGGEACGGGCVDRVESRFARSSKEHVRANLATVRAVLVGVDASGAEGAGFITLLDERGAGDVGEAMTVNIDAALAAVDAFDGSFEDALREGPDRLVAVYDAVKRFTDDLKSTFPSALGLRVPDEGAGDND